MTQNEAILAKFLAAPNGEVSNRYLRRICGFNEANARIVELNQEWSERGLDIRIVNTGRRDGRFSIHGLEGADVGMLGRRKKTVYELVMREGRPVRVPKEVWL